MRIWISIFVVAQALLVAATAHAQLLDSIQARTADRVEAGYLAAFDASFRVEALGSLEPGGRVSISLGEQGVAQIRVEDQTVTALGADLWTGTIDGEPESYAQIVLKNGVVAGEIRHPGHGSWTILPAPDGRVRLVRNDPDTPRHCGTDPQPPVASAAQDTHARGTVYDVHAIAYYTEAARAAAGGTPQIEVQVENAIAYTNNAMTLSNTQTRIVLTDILPVDPAYVQPPEIRTMYEQVLDEDIPLPPGVLGVPDARADWAGADLMVYFAVYPAPGTVGVAQVFEHWVTGCPAPFYKARNSVNHWAYSDTVAHEIGHNMSAGHGPSDPTSPTGTEPYSQGHTFVANGQLTKTVMAYEPGINVPFYSNPSVSYLGVPTGVSDLYDNARSMRQHADCVTQSTEFPELWRGRGQVRNPGYLLDPMDPDSTVHDGGYGRSMDADGNLIAVGHPDYNGVGYGAGAVRTIVLSSGGLGGYGIVHAARYTLSVPEQMTNHRFGENVAVHGNRVAALANGVSSGNPAMIRVFTFDGSTQPETFFLPANFRFINELDFYGDVIVVTVGLQRLIYRFNPASGGWDLEQTVITNGYYGTISLGPDTLVAAFNGYRDYAFGPMYYGPVVYTYSHATGLWEQEPFTMRKPMTSLQARPVWGVAVDGDRIAVGRGIRVDLPEEQWKFGIDIWKRNDGVPLEHAWLLEADIDILDNRGATDSDGTPNTWQVSPGGVTIEGGIAAVSNWSAGPGYRTGAVHTVAYDELAELWALEDVIEGDREGDAFGWRIEVNSPGVLATTESFAQPHQQRVELWVRREEPRPSPCSLQITQQPENATITDGGTASISVAATTGSALPISYRWHFNGEPIEDGYFGDGSTSGAGWATGTDTPVLEVQGQTGYTDLFAGDEFTCHVTASGCIVISEIGRLRCAADTNADGSITPADFTAWLLAFNSQSLACDQNSDNVCSPADFTAWLQNFNSGC